MGLKSLALGSGRSCEGSLTSAEVARSPLSVREETRPLGEFMTEMPSLEVDGTRGC